METGKEITLPNGEKFIMLNPNSILQKLAQQIGDLTVQLAMRDAMLENLQAQLEQYKVQQPGQQMAQKEQQKSQT